MKKAVLLIGVLTTLVLSSASLNAATAKYWDINGSPAGAGGATPAGTWNTAAISWNLSSDGTDVATTFVGNDIAVFAAGTDATGSYTVTVAAGTTNFVSAITNEEGTVLFGPGTIEFGIANGTFDVLSGATCSISGAGSGFVSGSGGITKNGPGTLLLGGSEQYFNSVAGAAFLTINGGTVDFSADLGLGTVPAAARTNAVLINGGTLRYSGTAAIALNVARGVTIGPSGGTIEVVSTAATGLSLPAAATFTINGGPSALLTKTGAGRFTMNTTANTYTGKYKVIAGSLNVPGDGRFGNVPGAPVADYFTLDGSTAALRDGVTTGTSWSANRGITLGAGGGAIQQPGGGTTTDSLTYNGIIAGTLGGTLRIEATDVAGGGTSDGIVILGGANTYNGATTIATGMTLQLGASSVIPDTSVVTVTGFLDLNNFNETIGGLAGGGVVTNGITGTKTLTVNQSTPQNFSGNIKGVTGNIALVKQGAGVLTMSSANANTHSGGTTISAGGIVAGAAGTFGTGPLTISGGTLSWTANRTVTVPVALNGDVAMGDAVNIGNPTFNTGAWQIQGATRTITISNILVTVNSSIGQDAAGRGLTIGAGTTGILQFQTGLNSYSGATTVNGGALALGSTSQAGDGTGAIVLAGGGLFISANRSIAVSNSISITSDTTNAAASGSTFTTTRNVSFISSSISGTSGKTLSLRNVDGSTATALYAPRFTGGGFNFAPNVVIGSASDTGVTQLQMGNTTAAGDQTWSGTISGPGSISRVSGGTGRSILTQANTYSGGTTVSAGTLLANNSSGSGTGSGAVTVASGGTLGGTGTIGGLVTVNSGGTLAPGASIGTLTLSNAPALSGTTAMEIDKTGTTTDQIVVSTGGGTLTYGGILSISYLTGSPAVGDAYPLFVGASDATPKYAGAFASITPATPGLGLAWDTSTLTTDGTLRVVCGAPTTATAGGNQIVCGLASTGLNGNTPTIGSGTWAQFRGPGTATFSASATTPNAIATVDAYGTYVFRWTIHNSACADNSLDTFAAVQVVFSEAPTAAAAGPDQSVCSLSATLAGNTPAVGTGTWSQVSGPGTVTFSAVDATTPGATATASAVGTYVLRWSITNGACAASTDDVQIVYSQAPSIATPPSSTDACTGSAANFSVAANGGSLNYAWRKRGAGWGTGNQWQLSSGANSGFFTAGSAGNGNGSSGNINTSGKSWGMYANSGDTAAAVRSFPSMSVGQTFQIDMDNGYIDTGSKVGFQLRNSSGEVVWEFSYTGGAAINTYQINSTDLSPNIGFTADGLRIAVTLTSSGAYSAVVTTPVGGSSQTYTGSLQSPAGGQTITDVRLYNQNAGFNSSNDIYFNSVSLGAYDDDAGAYTGWSNGDNKGNGPLANGGHVSGAATANLAISPADSGDAGSYDVFISNSCGQITSSPVTLTVNSLPTITLGASPIVCFGTTSASLAYSATTESPTQYSINFDAAAEAQGFVDVTLASLPATPITITVPGAAAAGTYNGTLTVKNANGCLSTSSAITLTINPAATVNAGADQIVCASSPNATLAGSFGGSASSATWSGGAGSFNPDNTTTNAIYTPSAGEILAGTVTLTLTTDDPAGVCGPVSDSMTVTINPAATVNAGPDQTACGDNPATTLAGSIAGSASSATWSGGGGSFAPNPGTLNATYTPTAGEIAAGTVTLTLTTDDPDGTGPCGVASDSMVITIDRVTATNVTYVRNAGSSLKISKTNLLTNASDSDLETISLVGVGTDGVNQMTTNGVTLTTDADWIFYTNSVTLNAPDSFSYKVTDTRGCIGLGTVTIQVITNGTGQGTTVVVSGGTAVIGFAGIPGRSYEVQRSTNLADWATIGTTNAPSNGIFQWVDDFNDLGVPPADPPASAYYRLRLP